METISRENSQDVECDQQRRTADVNCRHCVVRHRMLFADIDVEAASPLLKPIKHLWFRPGDVVYRAGEHAHALYSVRRGVIKLSLSSADGDLRIVRLIGPGGVIGMEGLVEDFTEHEAEALTDADLCRLPLPIMRQLAAEQPVLCKGLMKQWQSQLSQADHHLLRLSMGPIRSRVSAMLLEMDALSRKGGVDFRLPSNADIASLVAARVETVSRVMAELKREGDLVKDENGDWLPGQALISLST